jgi:hypothetical protein
MTRKEPIPFPYRPEATTHLREGWAGAHCDGRSMSTVNRTLTQINALKLLCVGCPVIKRCGTWGVNLAAREDVDEVMAGMTRKERDQVRSVLAARRAAAKENAA